MVTMNGVASANALPPTQHMAVGTLEDYPALTPDTLLLFCQSRLKTMDESIDKKMQGQKSLVALQGQVSAVEAKLKEWNKSGADTDEATNDPTKLKEANDLLNTAIETATSCGDKDLVKTLNAVKSKLNAGDADGNGDGVDTVVNLGEIKDMSSMLDSALTSCRGSAEVSMIEMQSLISQRAQIINLTTNMLNGVNEGMKNIVANTRG